MKKIILSLAFVSILISCKEETKEKIEDAGKAITSEAKANIDSLKTKAKSELDSAKVKAKSELDSAKIKSANLLEKGAKKLKE